MRTTLDIIIAVKDNEPATDEELRLALCALSGIEHFIRQDLTKLIQAIRDDKPTGYLKAKAEFAWGTIERMFTAKKKPPDQWLGPGGIPGTPENVERMKFGRKLFKAATGLDL